MSEKTCPECGRSWPYTQGVCPVCGQNLGGQVCYEDRPGPPLTIRRAAELALAWIGMLLFTFVGLAFAGYGALWITGVDSEPQVQESNRFIAWLFLIGGVALFAVGALHLNDTLNRKEEPR